MQSYTVCLSCFSQSLTGFTKQTELSLINSDRSSVILVSSNNKLLVDLCLSDTDSSTYIKITNKKLWHIILRLRTELRTF